MYSLAIFKSQYNIKNKSGQYDTYHFESSQGQIKVIDKNKNIIGTLEEHMFTGKLVQDVDIKTIKVSGMYKIRNLTGLPAGVSGDKIHILSVKAIGEINNPEVINYQIIEQNGSVHNKTIVGAVESLWSNGGTSLQNVINGLINDFGNKHNLITKDRANLVSAINEVKSDFNNLSSNFGDNKSDFDSFKNHNHDGRYLRSDTTSALMSVVAVEQNGGLGVKRGSGKVDNLVKVNSDGGVEIGNVDSSINIYGANNFLYNGQKVWTEVNDGHNSGLDADKLDGLEAISFAQKTEANIFTREQSFKGGANLTDSAINWNNGSVKFNPTAINVSNSGKNVLSIGVNGRQTLSGTDLIANYSGGTETLLNFKLSAGEKGIGFVRNSGNTDLRLYNYNVGASGAEVFRVKQSDNVAEFAREIQISGRKLYLQSSSPTGAIPEGSIWIY